MPVVINPAKVFCRIKSKEHRDALRLFHVKPPTETHRQLFEWVVKGLEELPAEIPLDD